MGRVTALGVRSAAKITAGRALHQFVQAFHLAWDFRTFGPVTALRSVAARRRTGCAPRRLGEQLRGVFH